MGKLLDVYKDNIGTAYNVQYLYREESQNIKSVSNKIKQKATELDRLHEAMKEYLKDATNSKKIQILALVPDSGHRIIV